MRILLLILFAIAGKTALTQNAFYNTQKLTNWRDSIFILSENAERLPDTIVGKKKSAFIDSINAMVFYYAGENGWDKLRKFPAMEALYDTIYSQMLGIKELKVLLTRNGFPQKATIGSLIDSIEFLNARLRSVRNTVQQKQIQLNNLNDGLRTDSALLVKNTTAPDGNVGDTVGLDSIRLHISQTRTVMTGIQQEVEKLHEEANSVGKRLITSQDSLNKIVSTNDFKTAIGNLTNTRERNRIISAYNNSTIGFAGEGFTDIARLDLEKAASDAIQQKNESLPALRNFSLPNQSEVIDALAIYLARRVKQEMVLAFTDQLKKSLKADSMLSAFFPETKRLFISLPDYEFSRFGTAWRYAISKDFVQLPENFFHSSIAKSLIRNTNTLYFDCLHDVYQLASLIRRKYNFLQMVEELNNRELTNDPGMVLKTKALKQFVRITQALNKELFNKESRELYWISSDEWTNFNADQFKIFWALVNVKYPKLTEYIKFRQEDSLHELSDFTYSKLNVWIKRILFSLNKFQADQQHLYKNLTDATHSNWEFQFTTYWSNVEDIISMVIDNNLVNQSYSETLASVTLTISKLFNTYEAIQNKNYVSAMEETLGLMESVIKEPQQLKIDKWNILFKDKHVNINGMSFQGYINENYDSLVLNGARYTPFDYLYALAVSDVPVNQHDPNVRMFNRMMVELAGKEQLYMGIAVDNTGFLRITNENPLYTQLINAKQVLNVAAIRKAASIFQDIILAQKSEELSQVIEKYAMPPGSYKIKRRSRISIDLNAYFGIYAGTEWVQDAGGRYNWGNRGAVVGLTAPIGFSLSWAGYTTGRKGDGYILRGSLKKYKGTSHTISLSIIDIAAVVSYRLSNAADKPLPARVTWGQVIAPGIFYRYGIRNTPLCFHLGCQLAPQLRTISDEENQNTLRFSSGITIDLPLLNLGKKI